MVNYTIPLNSAISIANSAHYGQVDKVGAPYILHPLRVMLRLTTPEERIVGVLHDSIEDTFYKGGPDRWTLERLHKYFPSPSILGALDAITRRRVDVEKTREDGERYLLEEPEPYDVYIKRCARHALARRVKIVDLRDNLDPERGLSTITPADDKRVERYQWALAYLNIVESGSLSALDELPAPCF